MARERTAYETLAEAHSKVLAERDELRSLWLEWLEGMYDGRDLLRRVRLAVHGPLRKPGTSGVGGNDGRFKPCRGGAAASAELKEQDK